MTHVPMYVPMTPADESRRARLLSKLAPKTKLLVTGGLKKGRTAFFVNPADDNPWVLNVVIDGAPRIVRFDWVEIAR
jgi:hypothetical protein